MPQATEGSGRPGGRRRGRRRPAAARPAPRRYTLPATHRSDAAQGTGARSVPHRDRPRRIARPAPRYELPSTFRSDAASGGRNQTKRAERYKRTAEYRARIGDVRRHFRPTISGALGQEIKSDRDLARATAFKRTAAFREARTAAAFARALKQPNQTAAPALKVLEQTLRPIHGIAAAAREDVRDVKAGRLPIGHGSLKAAGRGFMLKDKSLFSDVLKEAGVRGPAASIGGFALDVGLDPLTYLSGGTAPVARRAALKAAERHAPAAASSRTAARRPAASVTAKEARREQARAAGGGPVMRSLPEAAARQATRRAPGGRGVSVRWAGQELPGVTRATAIAGRGVARVTPAKVRRAGSAVHRGGEDVNPNLVPAGLTRAEHEGIRQAARTARSSTSREIYKVQRQARAVQKAVGAENYTKVLDAIERGAVHELPDELRIPARFLRDRFKYARRVEKRAGIRGGTRARYVPHQRADLIGAGKGMGAASVGARTIRPTSSRRRQDTRTLAEIRKESPGKYIEDPGVLYAARLSESATARGKAELNRRLAGMGRPLRPGRETTLREGEAPFLIRGSDIKQLKPKEAAAWLSRPSGGQLVALNARAVDRAFKQMPGREMSALGGAVDRVQGKWKFLATQPNPGFHLRNLAGDLQNAWLAESAPKLARNLKHAGGALRELGREEKALNKLSGAIDPTGRGIQLGKGKRASYAQLIAEAEKSGAIRSGFVSRELDDLMQSGKAPKPTREKALKRWLQNREDVVRLATYIGGRRRGLSPEQATARSSKYHFDYGDLTHLERNVLRRVMPFYTFSARNIPLQFKSLVTDPGKFAQYEKVRQEFARAFGYPDGWEEGLPEREQRAIPIPVVIDGKQLTLSLGPSGLPLTDINEFPATGNPLKQTDEWMQRAMSMVTPGIKSPVELWANTSFFFRDQIERDEGPLVPLSTVVAKTIPPRYRKELGVVDDYTDKRTGKKGWGAPGKLVYALGVLPGPLGFLNRLTTVSARQSPAAKTVGYFGLRGIPFDPLSTEIETLYEDRAKVQKRMRALNQRNIYAANATPAYERLSAQEKDMTSHIMALRTQRGDKINRPKKKGGWSDSGGGATGGWSDKGSGAKSGWSDQ